MSELKSSKAGEGGQQLLDRLGFTKQEGKSDMRSLIRSAQYCFKSNIGKCAAMLASSFVLANERKSIDNLLKNKRRY